MTDQKLNFQDKRQCFILNSSWAKSLFGFGHSYDGAFSGKSAAPNRCVRNSKPHERFAEAAEKAIIAGGPQDIIHGIVFAPPRQIDPAEAGVGPLQDQRSIFTNPERSLMAGGRDPARRFTNGLEALRVSAPMRPLISGKKSRFCLMSAIWKTAARKKTEKIKRSWGRRFDARGLETAML